MSVQGSHEFQARVNLLADGVADVASDSTLTFNNTLDLMDHTLTKTGAGTMLIRNDLTLGSGTIVVAEGTIAGNGTIGGDVNNGGGTISPGNALGSASAVPEPGSLPILVLGCLLVILAGGSSVLGSRYRAQVVASVVNVAPLRRR